MKSCAGVVTVKIKRVEHSFNNGHQLVIDRCFGLEKEALRLKTVDISH